MEWMFNTHNFQIDITSHCNARCAFCVRQIDGTTDVRTDLPLHNFDFEVWKRFCSEDTNGMIINEVTLNGNWGDPMMHPDLVEMIEVLARYHPEAQLMVHTNGSMRTIKFWEDFAVACRKFRNHVVMFAIDGMEDTHSIYRVRTKWDKIIENMKAFCSKDGRARGIMTIFKHNKHQIEQVKQVCKDAGAIEFETRHSHGAHTIQSGVVLEEDTSVEPEHISFTIEDGTGPAMSDQRDFDLYEKLIVPPVKSKCPWFADRKVQIDPWARVWPCCHVSYFGIDYEGSFIDELVDNSFIGARDSNDLNKENLFDILNNEWFSDTLSNAIDGADWKQCRETCGVTKWQT